MRPILVQPRPNKVTCNNRKVAGSRFHVLRKTFATNRLRNETAPLAISNLLGHSSTAALDPYLSLDNEKMRSCSLTLKELGLSFLEINDLD